MHKLLLPPLEPHVRIKAVKERDWEVPKTGR